MAISPTIVDSASLERSLDIARANSAEPGEGVFGPASTIWQIDREAVVFLAAGRSLLMQLAHPWVATAIAEHSSTLADPIGRFHRTFQIVFTLVFGSLDQAQATSRRLHQRHASIRGAISETTGSYPLGSPYFANEVSALMWVHATLVDTALRAYELVLPPVTAETRDRYYTECRVMGALFGIPLEAQPTDWGAFENYVQGTLASDALAVGPTGREIARRVLAGAGRVPIPRWYRDLTASLLPEHLRVGFELSFGDQERRRLERALRTMRRIYPALPTRLRWVGPYQEARRRLSGRTRPDLLTRAINLLWMGRASMPE